MGWSGRDSVEGTGDGWDGVGGAVGRGWGLGHDGVEEIQCRLPSYCGRDGGILSPGPPSPPTPGTAGVMISLSRILTKLLLPDERASTLIFFLVSVGLELLCFLLHLLVRRSRFVLYYTTRPRDSRPSRGGYRVHHDIGDIHFVSACWGWGWGGLT